MARPLTKYLKGGSYEGIDIVARSVQWCQRTYASRYPNFRFHFADIYNKVYNPDGKHQASEYRLPFETSSFDFVFLTSVFTHMLPQYMEHYLSEVVRVLKPSNRCLITYFLINAAAWNSLTRARVITASSTNCRAVVLSSVIHRKLLWRMTRVLFAAYTPSTD